MAKTTIRLSRSKIDIALARKSCTIAELARSCNMSRQRMSTILKTKNVMPISAGKIANALDVDVTDIID